MDQRSLYLIRQALNAVFKRRNMVVLLFLLIFVPSNVGNLVRDPVFKASAKVLISRARAYPEVSPLAKQEKSNGIPNESMINSELQLLRSYDLYRRVHAELGAQVGEQDMVGEDSEEHMVPSVRTLASRMGVVRKPNSNVVEVTYANGDPEEAVNIVNTLIRLYVDYHIEMHRSPGAYSFFQRL